ncbi:GNAT family N-acetyltransferase [Flavobacteriaceae bacterium F08102]|nr:GNAT family N-acetyltransferase [Flavobacteriaceae bacterium F08102]
MLIRKIEPKDNTQIRKIIQTTIVEFGLPTIGTAYEDEDTLHMYEAYQQERSVYFVLEDNERILGGGGIKPLRNEAETICELQKMYFTPLARGKGYGRLMMDTCLSAAKEMGYKQCYIETDARMKAAIHLYKDFGFKHLEKPMGGTGHYSCEIWMLKTF